MLAAMTSMQDDAAELLDPVWRLSNLYQIRTKLPGYEGQAVMYEPNMVQQTIYQRIEDGWKRIIILKPRKLGCTTGIVVYMLDKTIFSENQVCRTIAHRRQTVGELFGDIALYSFQKLKDNFGDYIPEQTASSSHEIAFRHGSRYSVDVESRGLTPTILHFTEVAYNEDENKLQDSLASLPRTALGIAESTANGKGNWFERTFMNNWLLLKSGRQPEWYPLFFAWFDDPTNVMPWFPETVLYYPLECQEMKIRFNLTDEQILFWDRMKYEYGPRLPELYPSTPEDAFIFSTGKVYGDEYRREINVIPPTSYPDYEIALDYGQTNPMAIYCVHRDADDNFIVFKEFYRRNAPLEEVRNWLMANCKEKMTKDGYFIIKYPDPSVFNETQTRPVDIKPGQPIPRHRYSIADEFKIHHKIILKRGVENDVPAGITRVKKYLKFDPKRRHPFKRDSKGNPLIGSSKLFITENCVAMLDEFDKYRWPKDPQGSVNQHSYEVPVKDNDHAMDALRYAIMTWTRGETHQQEKPPPENTIAYFHAVKKAMDRLQERLGSDATY